MKYWKIIADNLHKAGWSYGYVSALDRKGRTIWIVDAHGYGKRFIVRADEILTFLEAERAIHAFAVSLVITSLLSEIALSSVSNHYRNEGSDPSKSFYLISVVEESKDFFSSWICLRSSISSAIISVLFRTE